MYGFALALIGGKIFPGAYDLLRWLVPPSFALMILLNSRYTAQLEQEILSLITLSVPLLGLYGVYQFVAPAPWDAYWLEQVRELGILTFGFPEPFQVRVFGTLNSPHSFAAFLVFGIILLVTSKSKLKWVGIALGGAALSLTVTRTWWISIVLGLIVLMTLAPGRARATIMWCCLSLSLLGPAALISPEISETLERRVQTFQELEADESFDDRSRLYAQFIENLGDSLAGSGLGITGAYQSRTSRTAITIDSGIVDTYMVFGLLGGTMYLGALAYLCFAALRRNMTGELTLQPAWKGIIIAFSIAMTSLTSSVAEFGILFWIAIGCALCAPERGGSPTRSG
jgi:hypothetical protein